jgi:hypothetical protein
MRKSMIAFFVFVFCFSTLNAGIIFVPSNSSINAKGGAIELTNSVLVKQKKSKGKLFMKVFKSKFGKIKSVKKSGAGKSKVVAAILALLVGNYGIHDFYLGNKRNGFIKLGLTLIGMALMIAGLLSIAATEAVTWFAALPAIVIIGYVIILGVSIWSLVDFIRILTGKYEPVDGAFTD